MPNHVTTRLECQGPPEDLEALVGLVSGVDKAFSLNSIRPRPPFVLRDGLTLEKEERTKGRNWLNWSIRNWGTKWDAYDTSVVHEPAYRTVFKFDTAWSVPWPALLELSALFPRIAFEAEFVDEGWNFAGFRRLRDAKVVRQLDYECSPENSVFRSACVLLKGYDPAEEPSNA